VSDREIVEKTSSSWYSKLSSSEWGLGDQGFSGLSAVGFRIQHSHAGAFARDFASVRIRVEQKFADIKDWRATQQQIRKPLKGNGDAVLQQHHMIWTVVSVLVNDYR